MPSWICPPKPERFRQFRQQQLLGSPWVIVLIEPWSSLTKRLILPVPSSTGVGLDSRAPGSLGSGIFAAAPGAGGCRRGGLPRELQGPNEPPGVFWVAV